MRELVEFMEQAVREGLTKEEITSQVDLMLDKSARRRLKKSLKEVHRGKVKRFRDPRALLRALHGS